MPHRQSCDGGFDFPRQRSGSRGPACPSFIERASRDSHIGYADVRSTQAAQNPRLSRDRQRSCACLPRTNPLLGARAAPTSSIEANVAARAVNRIRPSRSPGIHASVAGLNPCATRRRYARRRIRPQQPRAREPLRGGTNVTWPRSRQIPEIPAVPRLNDRQGSGV